ncbi:Modification methylase RsrI [Phycisphaerales bacterium]|nr:Modification methylase RsrI [Phycisphaerales bacterium]
MNPRVSAQLGDWLTLAPTLPPHSIDLLYTDPPFNTGETQRSSPTAGRIESRTADAAYPDAWPTTAHYIAWLRARLAATLPALKPSASILIHCDHHASHHIRLLLDDLLGPDRFINHLIWSYGLGGSSPRRFARKHDDILFYCLDPDLYYFDPPMIPATSRRMQGELKKATDVLEIPSLNNMAAERTGYPTQKPLALLDLLICAACAPGGTVLDPTCGSGTTLEAALRAGRAAVGFDANPDAIAITQRRIAAIPSPPAPPAPHAAPLS